VIATIAGVRSLAVLGIGRSGRAAALLARRELPAAALVALDQKDEAQLGTAPAELRAAGAVLLLGAAAALPEGVELLVKSPGVPNASPVVAAALARGVTIWSEVEFAARFLANRWIAITGTNGKTTTTELAGQILRDAGRPVEVAGNVGRALANLPGDIDPRAVVVAELSSFQLEHIERFRPDVAVLLNLTEDHIDRHGSYAEYVDAKLRIFENQTSADLALVNADDPGVTAVAAAGLPGRGRRGAFSRSAPAPRRGAVGEREAFPLLAGVTAGALWLQTGAGREELCGAGELALKGEHNVANSLAAAAAAAAIGVAASDIARTLRTFPGVVHRLQVVGVVAGVTWVNDSKATNVDAALKALTAYSGPVHMILGGSLKGASFDPLAVGTEGRVKEAILIGAAAGPLREAFERRRAAVGERATRYVVLADLEAAVAHAAAAAAPGDVVLLSPACASFDHYRNFEHRGEHFAELVKRLEERRPT
jgi:UDP-N-acetylmuramoylalanine--D-glutamate ligase